MAARVLRNLVAAAALLAAGATPAPPPTAVTSIVVRLEEEGTTVVEVTVNGPEVAYSYRQYRDLGGEPRGILRLRGIRKPYSVRTIPVRDCNLVQVRIGHHPEVEPPELRLVFDLTAPEVTVLDVTRDGDRVVIRLGRPGSAPEPSPGATAPQPSPASSPTPTPTPTPPPPTPAATPLPLAPTPTTTASPRPSPSPRPTSSPTRTPPNRTAGQPPAPGPRTLYHSPGPPAAAGTATTVTDIVASPRGDGSTLLRITADQPFLRHDVIDYRDPKDPTRHVLLLLGVSLRAAPRGWEVNDACLQRIEVGTGAESQPPEARLDLVLTSSQVRVAQIAAQGVHLAVQLEPGGTK